MSSSSDRQNVPKKTHERKSEEATAKRPAEATRKSKASAKADCKTIQLPTPKRACGAFNFTGCDRKGDVCNYSYHYDPAAAESFYRHLIEKDFFVNQRLSKRGVYPHELNDLRKRHPTSLNRKEQKDLKAMPSLNAWSEQSTTLSHDQQSEYSIQQNAMTNQPGYHDAEELTVEEQEARIRDECARNIEDMIQRESILGLGQSPRRYMSPADAQAIVDLWNKDADDAIAKLRADQEKLTGPCYMQQERKEASACPDAKMTAVFRHRYIVVTPNSLGPYTRGYTTRNRDGVNMLMVNPVGQPRPRFVETKRGTTSHGLQVSILCSVPLYSGITNGESGALHLLEMPECDVLQSHVS